MGKNSVGNCNYVIGRFHFTAFSMLVEIIRDNSRSATTRIYFWPAKCKDRQEALTGPDAGEVSSSEIRAPKPPTL
jgi:hypothetical protein